MHTAEAPRLVARSHRVTVIKGALNELSENFRAQIQMACGTGKMACGTGKTLVGIEVADALTNTDSVAPVVVPSRALVDQWIRGRQDRHQGWARLAVCSGRLLAVRVICCEAPPVCRSDSLTLTHPNRRTNTVVSLKPLEPGP